MAGRNPRAGIRDMMLSIAVLLVPVLVIMAIWARPGEEKAVALDVAPVLQKARAESAYPVLVPTNLPATWVPTRVRWAKAGEPWIDNQPVPADSWQLGYMSPDGTYIGLQQRAGNSTGFIASVTRDGRADGTVEAGGFTWQRYTSADGRTRSLVSSSETMTAIVSGDTEFAALEAYSSTLKG